MNLDKDPKELPTGRNLPAVPISFTRNPATLTSGQVLQRGGKQVMNALAAVKVMKGGGAPAAEPAAAEPAAKASLNATSSQGSNDAFGSRGKVSIDSAAMRFKDMKRSK